MLLFCSIDCQSVQGERLRFLENPHLIELATTEIT